MQLSFQVLKTLCEWMPAHSELLQRCAASVHSEYCVAEDARMVGGRLAKDWSGGKVELSSSLQKMLHLFVFVAVASDMANGQNAFNFNLSPSGAQERTLSPTTSVSVTCVWDVQQSITVGGVIDQTVILTPSSITQTNSGSQGQAVFVIAGSSLSLGEHTLVITATNGTALSAQVSTQATTATAAATTDVLKSTSIPSRVVSVSITVLLYNEEYLTGLALSSTRNFYEAVNTSATLTASVVQGTGLQTSWSTDNNLFVKVNVSSKTFSSPLQWTTLGRHSVSLNVSNRHGSLSAQTDVTVLYPINGVDFPTGQVTKAINEEVVLTLTTSNIILQPMGNVTYQLTWDTGVTEGGDLNVTASQVRAFTHSYSVQGDRNVTLELTSPAQKKVFLVLVRIWDNLNVNLHLSATVGLPGDNFTLTFVNPPTAGFRYNISCSKPNYIFQNGPSALYANFSPPNPPFSVTFSAVGVYVFTFEAFNGLYSLTTRHTIIIENVITASSLALSSAKNQIPTVDSAITVYASAVDKTKSNTFSCTWDSGQNDQTNYQFFYFPENFPIAQDFEFGSAGNYTVTLYCRNNLSDATFTYNTRAYDWQLANFQLSYELTKSFNGDAPDTPVLFTLSMPGYALPTRRMSVTFDYGDGSPLDRPLKNMFNHSYLFKSRGIYNGSVLLSHQSKGNTTFPFSVRVGAIQLSVESIGGLVGTHLFRFFVSYPKDSCLYSVTVDFGDGHSTILNSNPLEFTHYYETVGYYTANMTGACGTFAESSPFPGPLVVEGSVYDLKLQMPKTVRHPPGHVNASVYLDRSQHQIMNMTCKMNWDEILVSTLGTWNGSLQPTASFLMYFTYETLGAKELVLNCSNAYSDISLSAYLFVDNVCFSPDPIFDRQFAKYHKPMVVLQSVKVKLITRTVILCTTHKPTFEWSISVYSRDGAKLSNYTNFQQPNVDYLTIERGELEPGLYRMALNISLGEKYNNSWLSESTFVEMERPPLVAEIQGGRIRKTGYSEDIIDARTGSYDPVKGYGISDDLVFSWNCSVYDTATVEDLLDMIRQSNPGDPQPCDDISKEIVDGKRQLVIGENVEARGFMFEVAVSSKNATSNIAEAYLQYNRHSLSIQIVCVMNCDRKVAISTSLVLSVKCDDCSDESMANAEYSWTLYLIDSDTGQQTEVQNAKQGQTDERGVVIKEKTLEKCKKYRVEANMTLPTRGGFAVREFVTNCPPWGGNCTVYPLKGNVLNETFRMECSGWMDEGFEDDVNSTDKTRLLLSPLIYKFLLRKNDTIVPISEGGQGKMAPTKLPFIPDGGSSEYELVVRIYDPLQDFTEYSVPVELYLEEDKNSNLQETLKFWEGQNNYSGNSSTLTKEMRGITVAGYLIANSNISDNQTELQQALGSNLETSKPVVSLGWNNLWNELKDPPDSPNQNDLIESTNKFANMVHKRGEEAKNLTGLGLTALAHGLSTVLSKPETVSSDSVKVTTNVTDMAVEALRTLYTTKPYPIAENLKEPVLALTSLVDRLVAASVPSYKVLYTTGIEFNASDLSNDDKTFVKNRLEVAVAKKDHLKTELINEVMPQLETTLNAMTDTLLVGMVVGQEPERAARGGLSLMACKTTGETLASNELEVDPNNVALKIHHLIPESEVDLRHAELDVKANVFTKNPYPSSDLSSYDVTSPVVKLDVRGKNGTVRVNKLTVTIKRGSKIDIPTMETFSSNDTHQGPDNLLYHRLPLTSPHSAIITYIKLPPDMEAVTAYFRLGSAPTLQRYHVKVEGQPLHSVGRRDIGLDQSLNNKIKKLFKFSVEAGFFTQGIIFVGFLVSGDNNDTYTYEYLSFIDSCRVWDEENRKWSPACKISDLSSLEKTVCECENPPGMTFASAFLVPPTTINFRLAFSKFDVSNAWVYGTMIGLLLVWVLGVLWARRQDKADRERWQVGFLTDNVVGNSYFYLLTVHTGLKRGSGTKSNISFVITGSQTDSGVRGLTDGKRSLATGSVMSYIMATSTCLGDLDYMRVWHDNSGGYQASWYLSRMSVEDLQTGQRYMFVCERWFAMDKDDGLVDRLVPLAQQDEVMSFDNLFSEFTKLGLTDTHLWFSCLLRPAPSAFTRVQRLSCCVVLLLLTMITSAMFYKPEDNETGASTNSMGLEVKIGIMRFSPTTLWTSFVSILITSIPTSLFVVMFRYSRPKPGPRARPTTRQHNQNLEASEESNKLEQKDKSGQAERSVADLPENKLQENPLPYYCRYVTWLILLTTAALCAFFLVMYSMQWGKTTSGEWLTSFFASFFESIFVVDPIKVIAIALLLAFCAQNPYKDTAHKEHVDMECMLEEAKTLGVDDAGLPANPPDPVPQKVLLKARRRREQEQTSQRVFFELLLYTFFVFCVFCLSYTNRDENSNRMYQHLSNMYFDSKRNLKDPPFLFEDIKGYDGVMKWLNDTMRPTLFPRVDTQGNTLQQGERVFTSDPVTFRVGPVRVRQLRMPVLQRNGGKYPQLINSRHYVPPYKWEEEERGRFCVGWKSSTCSYDDLETRLSRVAWTYQTLSDVSVLPVWGEYSTYSSGGYIMDFSVNWDVVSDTLEELQDGAWLDNQTRAVFVEFSLYNPDSKLFAYMRLVAEFPETGDTLVWKDIKILRIDHHMQAADLYMLIGEIIAVVAVIILTVVIVVKLKKQKLSFFSDFWQVLDVCTALCSYVAITFYAIKYLTVNESMAAWRQNPKAYVDFYQAAFWDALYGYMLAAAVFITTLRLLRVLGYNKRLTAIGTVLSMSGRDLLGFSVVFLVVFVAYLSAGYLMFMTSQRDFRSPWHCALALYQILLGRNVLSIISVDGVLFAWIYFISFIVLVFLILMTMFQAILCNTSSIVQADLKTVPPPYGLTNLFVKFYHSAIVDWLPPWLLARRAKAAASTDSGPLQSEAGKKTLQQDERVQGVTQEVLAEVLQHLDKVAQSAKQKRAEDTIYAGCPKTAGTPKTLIFQSE